MDNKKILSIIFAVLGGIGIIYFFSSINDPWFSYGVICCDRCVMLTYVIVVSINAVIVGLIGLFEQKA